MTRRSTKPLFILASLIAVAACKPKDPPPPNEPPPSVGPPAGRDPDEDRLLGIGSASAQAPGAASAAPVVEVLGLRAGDAVGPVTIQQILPLAEGRLPVLVHAEQGDGRLEVALRGKGPPPPATTKRFAIYWRRDPTRPLPEAILDSAAQALAKRLAAGEEKLVTPAGMRSYGAELRPKP